ncbi:Fanconi anemia group M protein isoform X2 [Prunus yedoensis var. nudiflora]|uniref:Fanconi anemia group M protein isoform X2 n=1 Tax=Prunus yedoensis var. nudiflora TaxID=2094558 RepID=A0A314YD14_PRUYE|nr:Fanconi anemia group M protein isoform X2 [Prunus yedoensis var. nudiflora]
MIPHIFKPDVQFVEFSIEQFVHRGKKVIDDNSIQTPVIADKLTVAETTLIAKYFDPHEITWKPSLIAFPHFQTYPSRVYKVMHSHRTTMLIDMMQCLQGLTFSRDSNISLLEDEICLKKCLGVDTAEQHDINGEDSLNPDDSEVSPTGTLETEEKHNELNFPVENPYEHSYLFGSDVVTVDASGNILIMVVPVFPWKDLSHSMPTSASIIKLDYLKQNSCHARTSDEDHTELTTEAGPCGDLKSTQITCMKNEISLKSRCCDSETWMEKSVSRVEKIPQTPILKGNLSNQGASVSESPDVLESKASLFLADEDNNFFRDGELSPRLTNLIKSGVVPESPIHNSGLSNNTDEYLEPDPVSPAQLHTGILLKCSSPGKSEKVDMRGNACGRNVSVSPVDNEIQTPLHNKGETASIRGCTSTSPIIDRAQTVLADLTNNSCGKDWHLSSGDKSESVKQARKFRRLRKVGDHWKSRGESMTKNVGSTENPARSFSRAGPLHNKHDRGKKKSVDDVRVFIEEEAEVSSEADISDDEEDERDNYSNDSFIDDRINPTVAGTQFATGGIDMMAIYRRSLLTQSPLQRQPSSSTTYSPDSVAPTMWTTETGSSCGKPSFSLQTPQSDCTNQPNRMDSKSFQMNCNAEGTPCTTGVSPGYEIESRKRKLGSHHSRSVPAVNLEREFSRQSEAAGRDLQHNDANGDVLYDDLFFEGLDFDAVEAQATLLLKQKSELPRQKQQMVPNIHPQNPSLQHSPTFDLGI